MIFSVGEENTNTPQQREEFSEYLRLIDPYDSPIVSQSISTQKEETYAHLLGYPTFEGPSLNADPDQIFDLTLEWRKRSADAGRKWIVTCDEQGAKTVGVVPDESDPMHDSIRKNVLWGNIMAGGA